MRTGELGTSSRIRNSNDMVRATVERLTEMLAHSWSLSNGAAVEFDHVTPPLFEPVLNAIETVVFIADTDGNLRYVNAAWERLTGFGQSDVGTLTQAYYLHPRDQNRWVRFLDACKRDCESPPVLVLRFLTRDGETMYLEASAQALISGQGRCEGFVGTLSEVGSRVQQEGLKEASHRTVETLINNLPGLVYRCRNNRQWTMEYMSKGCEALTGYPPEDLVNNKQLTYADLILRQDREQVWEHVQASLRESRPFELMYRIRTAQGEVKWVLERGHGNFYTSGELLGVEGFITDITRERHEQLRLRSDGLYDAASGLPTPTLFLDRLKMALAHQASSAAAAVLVLHLDQFENWCESLSADSRERALLNIGRRIESVLDRSDSLCRWARNEFAVLHAGLTGECDASQLAEQIQRALRAPVGDGDDKFLLTTSIGIATGLDKIGAESAESILSVAATAAARAGNLGIGRIQIADMSDAPAA